MATAMTIMQWHHSAGFCLTTVFVLMAFHTSEEIIPVCQGVNLSSFDVKHFNIQDEGVI